MLVIKSFFFIVLLFFFQTQTSYSNNNSIAYLNVDYLIKNSKLGKQALMNISKIDKKNIDSLQKKNDELNKLETEINAKKNILSEENFENEILLLKKKINEYQIEKDKMVNEFNSYKKAELNKVFKIIAPNIKKYMEENSIKMILDTKNIFIADKSLDITEKVLNSINND